MADQKKQIRELIENNHELENYFRNTIIPQLYIDGALKLQKFTPPAMKQFSLKMGDVGRHIDDIKDNFRFPTILEDIMCVVKSNEILEKEIQTTDLRWYEMNIIPYVKMKDNSTDGVIMTFVEITSRIKDLKELESLVSNHEILLDTISHDIKNPLSNLVMAIELFKDGAAHDKKEFNALLKIVDNALHKMHKLIKELTEVRKGDHKYKSEEELLRFEEVFEDVRLTLSDNIIAADALVTCKLNISEITFSKRKLRTILYNLIYNAIKFRDKKRRSNIVVSTHKQKDFMVITVKDNGIGIKQKDLESVFSKYYKLSDGMEGSGIGLYLVKEIVTREGGKILLKSQVNKGTEFKVFLKIN